MESPLVVTLRLDELRNIINESVEAAIKRNHSPTKEESLLCRKEVAKLFGVSLVTISSWTKSGKIPCHRIGSRIFFIKSELIDLLASKSKRSK